jgi:hypothetical protein
MAPKNFSKLARGEDLEDAGRAVARVPEGVHESARLEHIGPGTGRDDAVADPRADLALDDVRVLVDIGMGVDRAFHAQLATRPEDW